mgnify:CR=1 FL=1
MKKVIVLLLTVATLVSCMTIYSSADDYEIEPFYNNVGRASTNFNITSSGLARMGVTYYGFDDAISYVKSEIYLEKKFLGLFWNRVDIGVTDDVWVDYSYTVDGSIFHEFQLSDTGTYRAVFKVTIYGKNGLNDVIEEEIDQKYS